MGKTKEPPEREALLLSLFLFALLLLMHFFFFNNFLMPMILTAESIGLPIGDTSHRESRAQSRYAWLHYRHQGIRKAATVSKRKRLIPLWIWGWPFVGEHLFLRSLHIAPQQTAKNFTKETPMLRWLLIPTCTSNRKPTWQICWKKRQQMQRWANHSDHVLTNKRLRL